MSRTFVLMSVAATLFGISGCQSCCRRPTATSTTVVPGAPCPAPPAGAKVIMPPGFAPGPGAGVPTITPVPPGANPPPPPPTPPGTSSLSPRFEPNWQPADAREAAKASPSDPLLGTPGPKLYPPEVGESSPREKSSQEPPLIDERLKGNAKSPKSAYPAGIAQFSKATPGAWNGLRPSIEDGLDWLAAREFRTVLHLRAPGDPENADRKQVEKLGMTYLSIEVSPQTLSPEKFEEFTKIVRDVARQPVFVYDQDGSIAGALWYLYFRKVDGHDDEVARIRARDLGLRETREGSSLLMWLAVQRYLEKNP